MIPAFFVPIPLAASVPCHRLPSRFGVLSCTLFLHVYRIDVIFVYRAPLSLLTGGQSPLRWSMISCETACTPPDPSGYSGTRAMACFLLGEPYIIRIESTLLILDLHLIDRPCLDLAPNKVKDVCLLTNPPSPPPLRAVTSILTAVPVFFIFSDARGRLLYIT